MLLVDAIVSLAAAAIGVWVAIRGSRVIGPLLIVTAATYGFLVLRRARRWRRLRRQAGLS